MDLTELFEMKFLLLVAFSIVLPPAIYGIMLAKKVISRPTVLFFGVLLIVIAGADVVLINLLSVSARHTLSTLDDKFFASQLKVALYLLPAVFAGIGINVVSHILISHLVRAENKYDQVHPRS
ncbi:MAG TPA: hypothetical protein DIT28_14590 [Oxalobacteraceae bacterium]|jgi:hypothetical protein|nr:hypothetical protein [Oxalobacteraceae bacterium]HCN90382.1 hypothetical protein [Oxalobacteraceae bacterium]